jgi:hypothetical protein
MPLDSVAPPSPHEGCHHSHHGAAEAVRTLADGAGHAGHDQHGGHASTFSWSTGPLPLLFDHIVVGPGLLSYLLALLMVVLAGVLRQHLVKLTENPALPPLTRTVYYATHSTLAYLLMLVSMTFNIGLFSAVILGLSIGYHRFLQKIDAEKAAECCS